ncbi:hypothetical protein FRC09_000277 [Ceratobasidium sp. 395]|nr:hypothetical protein FRC09_000277 [Ceratobasidium sp. 395]
MSDIPTIYDAPEDILTAAQIEEYTALGLLPADLVQIPKEDWEELSDDLADLQLTAEDVAALDAAEEEAAPIFGPLPLAQAMTKATEDATARKEKITPRPWQLDVAMKLHERDRDVLVLAGTGSGKTLPFVMPCLLMPETIVWIVSPLNYIQNEQAKVFSEWGLRAVAVNSMTLRPGLLEVSRHALFRLAYAECDRPTQDIEKGRYQVVLSSIESMLASNKLRPALKTSDNAKRRQILVVDEAHCLSSWSESGFRPLYATVGKLRRLLPPGSPVLAATATANRDVRSNIQAVLAFRVRPYVLNLGNFRANLIHEVHRLQGGRGSVKEILKYFPSKTDLPLALIFVDSRAVGQAVLDVLLDYVDPSVRGKIHFYHTYLSDFCKRILARGFQTERFRILICTEALTMGADFRRVSLVINFMSPSSLLTWLQRAGRGARLWNITCRCILMAQASLFEDKAGQIAGAGVLEKDDGVKEEDPDEIQVIGDNEENANNGADDEENMNGEESGEEEASRDVVEAPKAARGKKSTKITYTQTMIRYINHRGCRNAFFDREYGNPARPDWTCTTCDHCLHAARQSEGNAAGEDPDLLDGEKPSTEEPSKPERPVWLRPAERESCEDKLRKWRAAKWDSPECAELNAMESFIMPDDVLTSIAKHPELLHLQDFETTTHFWPHYKRWGDEVLVILHEEYNQRMREKASSVCDKMAKKFRTQQKKADQEERARKRKDNRKRKEEAEQKKRAKAKNPKEEANQVAGPSRTKKPPPRKRQRVDSEEKTEEQEDSDRAGKRIKQESIESVDEGKGKGKAKENAPKSRWEELDQHTIRLSKASSSRRTLPS